MGRVLVVLVLSTILGCGNSKGGHAPYVVEHAVCVDASGTAGSAQAEPMQACKTAPDYDLVKSEVQGLCGPCGFSFDLATTQRERAKSTTACCYAIMSPPAPP
ncbi:MAG: hypothetical protein WKG01_12200 [Kofleriaceae bacterium]